jgi:(2R)-3-sulfolactate dehydrogenase (NADP+)
MKVPFDELQALVSAALQRAGARPAMAEAAAASLVRAEALGMGSHGLSRVGQYATHLRNGRVNGAAHPTVTRRSSSALVVDAQEGLAFAACGLAVTEAIDAARRHGVAFAGVINSHHAGMMGDHLMAVAQAGMVGLAMSNSPSAMPFAGGKHAVFGTNPIAAIFPREQAAPVLIDLALSEVARGKVMVAAKKNEPIPLGWALDAQGQATTDAAAALAGSMLPVGAATSNKGAMLALMVELLCTAVIGAQFGFEASSFFVDEGNRPRLGQIFLVINPEALAGQQQYLARIETLIAEVLQDDGPRLPGARRETLLQVAQQHGVAVADDMLAALNALAMKKGG